MVSMIAGGLFNAVAFAGAGYLFSTFNKKGYQEEAKRHNHAMEEQQKANEAFREQEAAARNKERKLQEELYNAKGDIKDTNKALAELQQVRNIRNIPPPRLEDYYQPSPEMKKYQIMAVGLAGTGGGWLLHKLI